MRLRGNAMTSRRVAYVAGTFICMISELAVPQDSRGWIDIKDAGELRALYSNKTFRSSVGGVAVVEHYRADGKGLIVAGELRRPRTWEIKGADQVCVTDADGTFCYRFQRNEKYPNEYVSRRTPGNYMVVIKVEVGVPQF